MENTVDELHCGILRQAEQVREEAFNCLAELEVISAYLNSFTPGGDYGDVVDDEEAKGGLVRASTAIQSLHMAFSFLMGAYYKIDVKHRMASKKENLSVIDGGVV